jgi:uncharacterized protein
MYATSFDIDYFEYVGAIPKFHPAKQMAGFLLNLYDSEKIVGIVNGETYDFELRDPIFRYVCSLNEQLNSHEN